MHSSDIEKLFFKRLQELRNKKGVSAREMSLSLGQNDTYINQIENRHKYPSMLGFFYICEYLNITPSEFFDDDNYNPFKGNEALSLLEHLNEAEKDLIISILKDIVNDFDKFKRRKEDKI